MRKKWTPQDDQSDDMITFREKRKWQIALRRYVLEEKPCPFYAPYFGLDINSFREWIELQFEGGAEWQNFSSVWQFDHIIPITHFDFGDMEDMKLAWNFINIRVAYTNTSGTKGKRVDMLGAKTYFEDLFLKTGSPYCEQMVAKIKAIEVAQSGNNERLEEFLQLKKSYINTISSFTSYQYEQLNVGMSAEDILIESKLFGNK